MLTNGQIIGIAVSALAVLVVLSVVIAILGIYIHRKRVVGKSSPIGKIGGAVTSESDIENNTLSEIDEENSANGSTSGSSNGSIGDEGGLNNGFSKSTLFPAKYDGNNRSINIGEHGTTPTTGSFGGTGSTPSTYGEGSGIIGFSKFSPEDKKRALELQADLKKKRKVDDYYSKKITHETNNLDKFCAANPKLFQYLASLREEDRKRLIGEYNKFKMYDDIYMALVYKYFSKLCAVAREGGVKIKNMSVHYPRMCEELVFISKNSDIRIYDKVRQSLYRDLGSFYKEKILLDSGIGQQKLDELVGIMERMWESSACIHACQDEMEPMRQELDNLKKKYSNPTKYGANEGGRGNTTTPDSRLSDPNGPLFSTVDRKISYLTQEIAEIGLNIKSYESEINRLWQDLSNVCKNNAKFLEYIGSLKEEDRKKLIDEYSKFDSYCDNVVYQDIIEEAFKEFCRSVSEWRRKKGVSPRTLEILGARPKESVEKALFMLNIRSKEENKVVLDEKAKTKLDQDLQSFYEEKVLFCSGIGKSAARDIENKMCFARTKAGLLYDLRAQKDDMEVELVELKKAKGGTPMGTHSF